MSRKTAKQARVRRQRAYVRQLEEAKRLYAAGSDHAQAPMRGRTVPKPRHPTAWQRRAAAERRQRRSSAILLGAGGALLAAIVGYGIYDNSRRSCVDSRDQTVVDQSQCDSAHGGGTSGIYRWYYGGSRGNLGEKVSGGSFERGGFGRFLGHIGS